jgi:hypothetical protein
MRDYGDYSRMITKQSIWSSPKAGGDSTPKRQYNAKRGVLVTDTHTGESVHKESCKEVDNLHGWHHGRTAQAAKANAMIGKRWKIEYKGGNL